MHFLIVTTALKVDLIMNCMLDLATKAQGIPVTNLRSHS